MSFSLEDFVRESNRIEGIHRKPTQLEMDAHAAFLVQRDISVGTLEAFVGVVAGKPLRDIPGMDVRVGKHFPPPVALASKENFSAYWIISAASRQRRGPLLRTRSIINTKPCTHSWTATAGRAASCGFG